jgi:hypothetical protein
MTAAEIQTDDDPGNLSTQTAALVNRPVGGGGGGGMRSTPVGAATPRDYTAGFRALGYGDPAGERPGQHQVQTPEGRAPHGSDVPGTGVPGPAEGVGEAGAGEAAVGGAEAAGAASGLAELAPLALL